MTQLDFWPMIFAIVGSVVGGGALLKFIEFLIRRKDRRNKEMQEIRDLFKDLSDKMDEMETNFNTKFDKLHKELEYESADNARIRILSFSEEIQRGQKHSKEAFDQIQSDIDRYQKHCNKFPDYPNSRADMAIKVIEDVYLESMKLEKEGYDGFLS